MRPLVLLIAAALLLAGCAADDPASTPGPTSDPTDPTPGADPTATPTSSPTPDPSPTDPTPGPTEEENRPPSAVLSASVEEGEAPLNVTFTVDGSDADGDDLTWHLDLDGAEESGDSLPDEVVHTYEEGLHEVVLTVRDGELEDTATLVLNVTSGPESFVLTGSTSLPGNPLTSGTLGAMACAGFHSGESGQDCVFGDLPEDLAGRFYTIESDAAAPYHEFWDACDPSGSRVQEDSDELEGDVPDDAGCVVMWTYGPGTGEFTFRVD